MHPHAPAIAPLTQEIGRAGASLRGVAADEMHAYAALATGAATTVEVAVSRVIASGPDRRWSVQVPGGGGPLACSGGLVLATSSLAMRGQPGSLVVALDANTGAERWRVVLDATGWALIAAVAPTGDGGAVVGGSFAGTLRGDGAPKGSPPRLVSSAGASDGFVARLGSDGAIVWLVRTGGTNADAVQGVAVAGDRVAIAGTFGAGAELGGHPLVPVDARSPFSDAFVAELDAATGARRWAQTYGGSGDDVVAGVAIDRGGRVAVAGTAHGPVRVAGADLSPRGPADGLVVWFSPAGEVGPAVLLGGDDFDGASSIVAAGDRVVVAGFFAGTIALGAHALTATGDDAFLAALDPAGKVTSVWQAGGEGREEIAALAPLPGGFVAGVAHTARASIGGEPLPSPADPTSGAAVAVRGVP